MNSLKDILYKVSIRETVGDTDVQVGSIEFDSRKVGKSSAFVAVRGSEI